MNLTNRDCFRAVAAGVDAADRRASIGTASISPSCTSNRWRASPIRARFTPMNADVRADVPGGARASIRVELFGDPRATTRRADSFSNTAPASPAACRRSGSRELESARRAKPHLDLVLTHVDDRFDTGMRDAIGADAARVLPLLDTHSFTFLIEDPATVWHLGPQRYPRSPSATGA